MCPVIAEFNDRISEAFHLGGGWFAWNFVKISMIVPATKWVLGWANKYKHWKQIEYKGLIKFFYKKYTEKYYLTNAEKWIILIHIYRIW